MRAKRVWEAEDTEERSTQFAVEPMMLAERDRLFIKRLKVCILEKSLVRSRGFY